ncbi:MAG: hypothetical protein ACJAY2_003563 [Pseudomonadales bacterium]|jgi:hypothetical protein
MLPQYSANLVLQLAGIDVDNFCLKAVGSGGNCQAL